MSQDYGAKNIKVLEGLEAVRKRPGMYIGGTGIDGLHHLVKELVDNAMDEALAGHCDKISIVIHKDNSVSVEDNGRGIPVDTHSKGKSAAEIIFTVLHAGGKFDKGSYKVSGGLHGVGSSVVNALSKWMKVEIHKNGQEYLLEFADQKSKEGLKLVGPTTSKGTKVTFLADDSIFQTIEYEYKSMRKKYREFAFLNPSVTIVFKDERPDEPIEEVFHFEGGISEYVDEIAKSSKKIIKDTIFVQGEREGVEVDVALTYTNNFNETIAGFVNNVTTPGGGTHISGFKLSITKAIKDYLNVNGKAQDKKINLAGEDIREGVVSIVSVRVPEPQFEGQTKDKLGNPEVQGIVQQVFFEKFYTFLDENPKAAQMIIEKSISANKAREAAKKARDLVRRKSSLEFSSLPGKLADCSSRDPSESELFIVEGDSAGGCFSADTQVALTDGRNLSFKDIIREQQRGIQNFCYTIRKNGEIGIEKIMNARRTKQKSELVEVVLDNDNVIRCTPCHKFMLRDGTYLRADKLVSGQSLMPLYKKISKKEDRVTIEGYEMIQQPTTLNWKFTHMLADEWNLKNGFDMIENGEDRHHVDFNKLNNNPTNLTRLNKELHRKIHQELAHLTLHTQEVKDKLKRLKQSDEYREKAREQWTPEFREKRLEKLHQAYFEKSMMVLKELYDRKELQEYDALRIEKKGSSILKYDTIINRYFEGVESNLIEALETYNHKVVEVRQLLVREDVYDIEVPHTHNFALSSGVFVHNSAKQGRERRIQAILPLKGKPLNVEKARLVKILENEEIKTLITALGMGFADTVDYEKLRYHKIIIMADADVDGAHIATLVLTLFFRHFKELILRGHVYIAMPPLYGIKKGKQKVWLQDDEELARYREENPGKVDIQRYKGLGEMNPDQLWETTLNPQERYLKKVTIDDAIEADEVFSMLMGDKVEPRKEFIVKNAQFVEEIDI